ncbi:hypothetical protein GobsT_18260 [Gemmata obscuriglobus]|uniref:hypothetical protein n=1 Tax=Gemmata obscuriglobus TaxID=114 RepID=UPI00016C5642|nr:hypothetical protein [Gemmata obscuriglobus]QEG27073.1 hypothetical protein GobsT_18260 [Gemmata obscuriglobus]VTS03512.1 unnamed protein product [Gemmata obscuriglobus UQM 2246]
MTILAVEDLAGRLAQFLKDGIAPLPEGFFNSFEYTATGKALTHPIVFGLLARFAWGVEGVSHVGLDVALNEGAGVKFKPDVIGYTDSLLPMFILDYESPNSSDYRVIEKDVDGYIDWRDHMGSTVPYVIITTLPQESSWWECRWVGKGSYNHNFKDRRKEWAANPRQFWHSVYAPEFASRSMSNIAVVNIDGKNVTRVFPEVSDKQCMDQTQEQTETAGVNTCS